MKQKLFKTIILMVAIALHAGAFAQNVIVGDATDFQFCDNYLKSHPQDTIRCIFDPPQMLIASTSGEIAGQNVAVGDTLYLKGFTAFKDAEGVRQQPNYLKIVKVVGDHVQVYEPTSKGNLAAKVVETRTDYEITNHNQRRDVYYYQVAPEGSAFDGKIIRKAANKNGWSLFGYGGYQFGISDEACDSWTAGGGLSLSGSCWIIDGSAGVCRNLYSHLAEHVGEDYTAFTARVGAGIKPFRLDRYDVWQLYLKGGGVCETYKTDSKPLDDGSYVKSWGNYWSPYTELELDYRAFASGNNIGLVVGWQQKKFVLQNKDLQTGNSLYVKVVVKFGLGRDRIKNY